MQSVICVYLHGFLSSANSHKGQWLAKKMAFEKKQNNAVFNQLIRVTYPISSPEKSVLEIERVVQMLIEKGDKIVLMGSSMGGFYAQYVGQRFKLPYIMINPALNPRPIFMRNFGDHVNPATGESLTIDESYIAKLLAFDVARLDRSIPALLLMDQGDEVIDLPFALQRYQSCQSEKTRVKVFEQGDHAFQHLAEAWPLIKRFVTNS